LISLALASGRFGSLNPSTPLRYSAATFSASTACGNAKLHAIH